MLRSEAVGLQFITDISRVTRRICFSMERKTNFMRMNIFPRFSARGASNKQRREKYDRRDHRDRM